MAKSTSTPRTDSLGPGPDDPQFGQLPPEAETAEAPREEWVEWVGNPPYGREFESTRVISRADAKKGWNDLDPGKDLRWDEKNNWRIPTSDLAPEVVDLLTNRESGFKVTNKRT